MPIAGWPDYPPVPVGVSIIFPGKKPSYYSWGHKSENNCTFREARYALEKAWKSKDGVLCHNSKFDVAVATTHMGMPMLDWSHIHDSMFLIFLDDPHSPDLKLKPASERLLGMPAEEQDAIRQWCIDNKLMPKNAKEFGHLIYMAPGKLVGKYANGDTIRTLKLFKLLHPRVLERGMEEAYDRERRLLPVLLKNETQGVPVDYKLMKADDAKYEAAGELVDKWLRNQLKVGKDFNLDSDEQLADALVMRKKAKNELFLLTPGGARSVAKDSLIGAVTDKKVLTALQYRSRHSTAYGTFLHPWFLEATACGGIVHPSWNQVRQAGHGKDTAGARTGRLSASRFMNVPKEFKQRETGKNAYAHPSHIAGLPELPFMRFYMAPFKGEVWCKRDYMQQELRVLGHFGDGELQEQFGLHPGLDVHDLAAKLINERFGLKVTRDDTKTIGFGLLYGMGLGALAERLDVDINTAKKIKAAYLAIFPELEALQDDLKDYAAAGEPLTTWGGRQYFCEEPKFVKSRNRVCTFEYKMLNYLIQGSSADCTKEALIRYDEAKVHGKFLLTVHDEINISVPKQHVKSEMQLLREVMASVEFDVPMLSDGSTGPNWGALTKFKEK
jgi:DNA polymerase-1